MAIVYKYLSPDLKECYVGSTTNEDCRKRKHKCVKSNTSSSRILFEKYGYDNCSYTVLEICPLEEQHVKEQWWLEHSVGAVNQRVALLTEEAYLKKLKLKNTTYCEANREHLRSYAQVYGETHREERKAYREAHTEEAKAYRKAYMEAHKEEAKAYKKAYDKAHREQINARQKAYREAKRNL